MDAAGRASDASSAQIRAFMERDWDLIARTKESFWSEARGTPAERLAVADALRRHVALVRPDWPGAQERDDDLATHARVARMLRSVGKPGRR